IDFFLTDGRETIGPDTHNGQGQSTEGKALYVAKTGARKDYLLELALGANTQDPEFEHDAHDGSDAHNAAGANPAPRRIPKNRQPLAEFQVSEFQKACGESHKTQDEIDRMLWMNFKAKRIEDLQRRHFPTAIRWAMGTAAPKPQAVAPQKAMQFPVAA